MNSILLELDETTIKKLLVTDLVEGRTLLHLTALTNVVDRVSQHPDGLDVDRKDDAEFTALHYAAMKGNIKSMKILLQQKARLDSSTVLCVTPLQMAINCNARSNVVENIYLIKWLEGW